MHSVKITSVTPFPGNDTDVVDTEGTGGTECGRSSFMVDSASSAETPKPRRSIVPYKEFRIAAYLNCCLLKFRIAAL